MRGNGPPPKDPARRARRNAVAIGTTVLPAEGRPGRAPAWPLSTDAFAAAELALARRRVRELVSEHRQATKSADAARLQRRLDEARVEVEARSRVLRQRGVRERELWRQLWRSPQAVVWERLCAHRAVAMYVRAQIAGELGDDKQAKEARYREADLGLSPRGMQALRWTIAAPVAPAPAGRREPSGSSASPRWPAGQPGDVRPTAAGSRGRRGPFLQVVPEQAADAGAAS